MLQNILNHSHSGIRYIVLFLLVSLVIHSIKIFFTKSDYNTTLQKHATITAYAFYLNVIIGLALYFMSAKVQFGPDTMKDTLLRFFAMEHPLMILVSLTIIRLGMYKYKKLKSLKGNRILMITSLIALIVLLAAIPWPMRSALGVSWF